MNPLIWEIVRKDWQFNRGPLLGFALLGLISLALMAPGTHPRFIIGVSLLLTAVVIIGAQLVFATVVNERKLKTLSFLMSLPLTFMDYTKAKLAGNLIVFFTAWAILLGGVFWTIATGPLPNGLLPFALILMLELAVAYLVLLAVALISESEAWTIVVTTVCNVGISIFIFLITAIPQIGSHMESPTAVWNSTALSILGIELAIGLSAIAMVLIVQSRKTDFL